MDWLGIPINKKEVKPGHNERTLGFGRGALYAFVRDVINVPLREFRVISDKEIELKEKVYVSSEEEEEEFDERGDYLCLDKGSQLLEGKRITAVAKGYRNMFGIRVSFRFNEGTISNVRIQSTA